MPIKPTAEQAQRRLRIDADADLLADLDIAIDGAHAEMLAFLDRAALHEDAAAFDAAVAAAQAELDAAIVDGDLATIAAEQADLAAVKTGKVCTDDLITAQLLLIDVAVGSNSKDDRESKQTAAENIMKRHWLPKRLCPA